MLLPLPPPSSFDLSPSSGSGAVRITHSHTSESMSFTYQRTHKSVCIDTRPNLHSAHSLFDSDSEDEEECDGRLEQGQRPLALTYDQPAEAEPAGDPAWRFKTRDGDENTVISRVLLKLWGEKKKPQPWFNLASVS